MTAAAVSPVRPSGFGKKSLFVLLAFLVSLLLVEVCIRIIFAIQVGPRVLLYGTPSFRNYSAQPEPGRIELPGAVNVHRKGDHEAVGNAGLAVASGTGRYTKYFPNEAKIDIDEQGEVFSVRINAQGFRGADFSSNKPPGTLRVVTLGASSTFGYYDRDDETYPYYLQQELNADAKGGRFEVLNLGIPHLTSGEILALFRAEALPLRPDIVTFYEGINDSSEMPQQTWKAEQAEEQGASPFRRLRRSIAGMTILRELYVGARNRLLLLSLVDNLLTSDVLTYDRQDVARHFEGKSARFLANLSALHGECRNKGILFVVITQQARSMSVESLEDMTYAEENALIARKLRDTDSVNHSEKAFLAHKLLMDDLESWAHEQEVPLVDGIELLDQDREVLLSWVHLSPRGNRLLARALAERIQREVDTAGAGG